MIYNKYNYKGPKQVIYRLNKLLKYGTIDSFNSKEGTLCLMIPNYCLSFEILCELSEILGTKDINIENITKQDQYYPSDNPEVETVLYFNKITRWHDLV